MRNDHRTGPISGHVYVKKGVRGASWYYRARLPREVRKRLGPAWSEKGRPPLGYFTRRTAQAALDALLTDARRGVLPAALATGATFEDAAREWLRYIEHDRKRRVSTVIDYKRLVNGELVPEFGPLAVEALTPERIDRYRARLVAEGRLTARSVNKRLVVLHGILARAQRVYGLRDNAADMVDRQPERRSGDFLVLTPAEVEALARNATNEQDATLFRVAAFTGLRLGELRALRWGDLDFGNALIHVRRSYTYGTLTTPKSGKVRSVPLIDQAARALNALSRRERFAAADDLVFPNSTGGHLDDSRLRRRFVVALRAAGLQPMRLHDLRHTFGTLAVQAFPLSDVKGFMGHADIATTMIYVHHIPQVDAADRLTKLVASASGPPATPDSEVDEPLGELHQPVARGANLHENADEHEGSDARYELAVPLVGDSGSAECDRDDDPEYAEPDLVQGTGHLGSD